VKEAAPSRGLFSRALDFVARLPLNRHSTTFVVLCVPQNFRSHSRPEIYARL